MKPYYLGAMLVACIVPLLAKATDSLFGTNILLLCIVAILTYKFGFND